MDTDLDVVKSRLMQHETRLLRLEKNREIDKAAVDEIKKNTREIVALLRDAQGAWRVFEMIGKAAKPLMWVAGVIAAVSVLWAQVTGRKP